MAKLNITVEFSGGLEMLFSNQQKHNVAFPVSNSDSDADSQGSTLKSLITWLPSLMHDPRKELFILDGSIRPGILVLINDADWELEGEDSYVLKEGDTVLFVSTLHGG